MKYIKLFESFDDEGWEEVKNLDNPLPHPDDPWMKHKLVQMSKYTFDRISKVLNDDCVTEFHNEMLPMELENGTLSDDEEEMYHFMSVCLFKGMNRQTPDYRVDHQCTIYECEDEWYRVSYFEPDDRYGSHKLYICDQIDGIENLLTTKGMLD